MCRAYDTHGLPIELKALGSLGDKKAGVSKLELRKICRELPPSISTS